MTFAPPHEVRDAKKLADMIAHLDAGGTLPPVIRIGAFALSGSHRIAAHNALGLPTPAVEITESDYAAAWKALGWDEPETPDHIGDYHEFIDVLRAGGADLGETE